MDMGVTSAATSDVLNAILGIDDESPLATLRQKKPSLVTELQDYYLALFEPTALSAGALPIIDRYLVAVRVASHTRSEAVASWYLRLALESGVPDADLERIADTSIVIDDATAAGAALRHADLLTLRPADATQADLKALKDAGLTPAGIVSLSQVIAFVNYQLRLAAGLRALGGLR
jgi:CMD domain protein